LARKSSNLITHLAAAFFRGAAAKNCAVAPSSFFLFDTIRSASSGKGRWALSERQVRPADGQRRRCA